ncbi:MAG: response regulator, partial [Chloroflexota bacterium]
MDQQQLPTGETILIVDDSAANLRLLAQMLSEHGYRVRAAASGPRALESVDLEPPNLILLDIRMKGMDGFEVCRRLKAQPSTQGIPVIFISALTETEDKLRAFQTGGVDYVTKPFQLEEVLARIETHLALRRLQTRLEAANRKFARELALAGKVQCGFLPAELPQPAGYQMAAHLKPAREMSGDFYDLFGLPNGRFALVMADVVDKGVAAALFMALSWSLIRT